MTRGNSVVLLLIAAAAPCLLSYGQASAQDEVEPGYSIQMNARPEEMPDLLTPWDLLSGLPQDARPDPGGEWLQSECAVANEWLSHLTFAHGLLSLRIPVRPRVEPDPDSAGHYRLTATVSLTSLENYEEGSVLLISGEEGSPLVGVPGSIDLPHLTAAAARRIELQLTRSGLLVWAPIAGTWCSFIEDALSNSNEDFPSTDPMTNMFRKSFAIGMLGMTFPQEQLDGLRYPLLVISLDHPFFVVPDEKVLN